MDILMGIYRKEPRHKMEKHRDRKAYHRSYYLANMERVKEYSKKYHIAHKERHAKIKKEWALKNKDKVYGYTKTYRKKHPERQLRKSRREGLKKFGLTVEKFENMILNQGGKCTICGNQFTKHPRVDHNHTTGVVRDLLCMNCNAGLGFFKENINSLMGAISYIKKWSGDCTPR